MQFFVDSADVKEIRQLAESGLVDGVTTNPSLVAKQGRAFFDVIVGICQFVSGPVSAEVVATEADEMITQGRRLSKIAKNVVVKIPLTWEGMHAVKELSQEKIKTNVTLCFSPAQALLAAKAGATYISPFIGRLDDIGEDGIALIRTIREIYDIQNLPTQILAASIRTPAHVAQAAKYGAHCVTLPPKTLRALTEHKLTDKGLKAFLDDWNKSGLTFG